MPEITRVLVPVDSQSAEALQLALAYAQKILGLKGANFQDVILLVHTKHQLDHTSLSRVLGAAAVKGLQRGSIPISGGSRLHAHTMRTLGYSPRNAVIIVYYAEPKILDFVDGLHGVAGVVAVPDIPGEADAWVSRWGAIVHGESARPAAPQIEDAVFVRALEALSTVINLTTGLGNPRDKDMANQILRILRAKGHEDQSANIKSWAIKRGWKPDAATDLHALAKKIWALKGKPSLSGIYDVDRRYQYWRDGS